MRSDLSVETVPNDKFHMPIHKNEHYFQAVKMLLEAGASPEFVDKVSMESAFDVAQNEEVRGILVRKCYFGVGCFVFAYGCNED